MSKNCGKRFINGVTNYEEYIENRKENSIYLSKKAIVMQMLEKKERGEEITLVDQMMLVQCIQVSKLTGKLDGYYAISSSVMMNPICQERARKEGCICKECYSAACLNRYGNLCMSLEINHLILNNFLISTEAWATLMIPSTNGKARIEAHGDTASSTCAINYVRIIKSHSFLEFGVWTKNLNHYRIAFNKEGKPSNCRFIYSSIEINVPSEVPADMVEYVDHVFTVYTKEYAIEHKIHINCGRYDENLEMIDQKCRTCMRCYTAGTEFFINELLK